MAKKKSKVEERTIEVMRGDNCAQRATDEVKKLSGFDCALPIKAKLIGSNVEFEFLVGHNQIDLDLELAALRADAEQRDG